MVRYWNSDKYKVSFLGIPKCGSTSVRKLIEAHPEKDWSLIPDYKTFTVLRNPATRLISGYHELQRNGYFQSRNIQSFKQFLDHIEEYGYFNEHIYPMVNYYREVEEVFIMEQEFIYKICQFIGREWEYIHENKSEQTIHDYDVSRINEMYKEDFKLYDSATKVY